MKSAYVSFTSKIALLLSTICLLQFLIGWPVAHAYDPSQFVITVQTNHSGPSADNQFTIPTSADSAYNYSVDCDSDGSFEATNLANDYTCNYSDPGIYTVVIDGEFPHIYFNNSGDVEKLLTVEQWGDQVWSSMRSAFHGATYLTFNATDAPNLSSVTDMSFMFSRTDTFNENLFTWDVSSVTNMSGMFDTAYRFNGDISTWDVSSVTDMSGMFRGTQYFNHDLTNWNVSSVTDMSDMFSSARIFSDDLSHWDTSSVTDMSGMEGTHYTRHIVSMRLCF